MPLLIVDVMNGPADLCNPFDKWFPQLGLDPILFVAVVLEAVCLGINVVRSSEILNQVLAVIVDSV